MKTNPKWVVFFLDGKEILAISIEGLASGEIEETAKLLAYEKGVSPDLIKVGTR